MKNEDSVSSFNDISKPINGIAKIVNDFKLIAQQCSKVFTQPYKTVHFCKFVKSI